MFAHYLALAVRSLRQSPGLTALMILSLALGIGATISMLTVLHLLGGDPLAQGSAHIFYPEIDPLPREGYMPGQSKPIDELTYVDAMNLFHAHQAQRQAVVAVFHAKVEPRQSQAPFYSGGVMTTADFFSMFHVPFRYGGGWSATEGHNRQPVAVIADALNDRLFHGNDSVGRMIRVNDHDFQIVGVLRHWAPQPRFYAAAIDSRGYGVGDGVFLPLQTALAAGISSPYDNCYAQGDQRDLRTAPCVWLGLWVQLTSSADAAAYTTFLSHYVQQQIALGRLHRSDIAVPDLMQWLRTEQIVPEDVRQLTRFAFGFLLICVLNAVGLLLAKCLRRSSEIGVRRALGASRATIFAQYMVEAGIVGVAGGVLGLVFAEVGLCGIRHQSAHYASFVHMDMHMLTMTFVFALMSSLVAGLLPAWRACLVSPAIQVKGG